MSGSATAGPPDVKVHATGLRFGEGPRWHEGALWLSDMFGNRVVRISETGDVATVADVPGSPSGLGWLSDGRLLIVSMRDAALVTAENGQIKPYADLSRLCRGTPNDMAVDRHGRAYVGNAGCDLFGGLDPRPTNLVLVDNGRIREVADDLIFPNGIAIDQSGETLVVAETFAHRLTAFSVAPDGSLYGRRRFAALDGRTPDGICFDREGAVWVASAETGEILRVRDGGEITHRIDTGGRFAAACATGGPDRRTLFMVVSETTPEQFMRGESSCSIETTEIEVAGAGFP